MIRNIDARYDEGLAFTLIQASNADAFHTYPEPLHTIGGVGPFDFTALPGVIMAAVPLIIQFDTDVPMANNLNVTAGAADPSAVTVAELVIMINAAGFVDVTAAPTADGNIEIIYTGTGVYTFAQVYGLAAVGMEIGQGKTTEFVKIDTIKTLEVTPDINASENLETEDANMLKTSIKTDSFRKGFTGTITDTAYDYYMRSIIEGGNWDATAQTYVTPTQESPKIYFVVYTFSYRYARGENMQSDITDYIWKKHLKCVGDFGAKTMQKTFSETVFPISGLSYKNSSGAISGDTEEEILSIADYKELDVANL